MKKLFLIIITFVLAVTALPAQALVLPRGEEPSSTAQNQNLSLSFPTQEATTQPTPTPQTNNTPTTFSLNFQDDEIVVNPAVLNSWKEQTAIPKQSLIIRPENSLATELNNFFGQTPGAINQNSQNYNYRLDKIYSFIEQTAKTLDVPAIDPELTIENDRATTFVPPQNGQKINIYQSSLNALNALEKNQTSSGLIVDLTPPKTQLSQFNNMGITELIAHGVSAFAGSPKNRRHNIAVGVEKFKGIIVKQGEEFSFNKYLGDVDGQHGFLPELVIKATGTVPEFGGGLCQVSSTAFRAAMAAGLPITQRKNHAYAVQYYSPQGTDATIYPGVVDKKLLTTRPAQF